jgi:hypothetical protein
MIKESEIQPLDLHPSKISGVPVDDFGQEWSASSQDNSVRALDGYRNMAQRNNVVWRESHFRHGEIFVATNGTHAARLGGVASTFFHDLFDLDQGLLARKEFLHKYPFANPDACSLFMFHVHQSGED